ncbi:MAG: 1-deoxy-D-xylulose-5-phosphate reductoisomerase [Deltaproteobacteria bacterium]|nr:1-deoxy-D-xylulose-5-phosphate reductoisomerase [Deltaproteobacteria bacterium]
MKRLSILGSTGSIGANACDVVRNHPGRFEIVGLAAGRNVDLLAAQIEAFQPEVVAVIDEEHARRLERLLGTGRKPSVLWGTEGYREVAALPAADMVLSAMVGAAGLLPTLTAIEAGKAVALANKETLVMAGELVMERARSRGVSILPVDSEHSAVFQCLSGQRHQDVRRIILTASGGPFWNLSKEEMEKVTAAQALRHPNWKMGDKITVDSASMMNKGLEVIEAKWLFGIDIERIDVVVHPRSIVHSMVEYRDGSIIGQIGVPDMRIPIGYALSYPERLTACEGNHLNLLEAGPLEFFRPDFEKFPNLRLAFEAARAGGTMPTVLNAANEIAVSAFLGGSIGFLQMPLVIGKVLSEHEQTASRAIDVILRADDWARKRAAEIIEEIKNCSE